MEEKAGDLKFSQQELTQDIEAVRANCQQISNSLDGIEAQVNYAEENKKRVRILALNVKN